MEAKDSSVVGRPGHRCNVVFPAAPEFRLRVMRAAACDGKLMSQFLRAAALVAVNRVEKRLGLTANKTKDTNGAGNGTRGRGVE